MDNSGSVFMGGGLSLGRADPTCYVYRHYSLVMSLELIERLIVCEFA